ncbi:MAG: hypothetical protein J6I85_04925 [Clostridia bacterium]|nr:hypothetical protein [Clostridia bacterium]
MYPSSTGDVAYAKAGFFEKAVSKSSFLFLKALLDGLPSTETFKVTPPNSIFSGRIC